MQPVLKCFLHLPKAPKPKKAIFGGSRSSLICGTENPKLPFSDLMALFSWECPGGHGNALFVLAVQKPIFPCNMLILCKIAYKSLLINVVLLSGAPELRFLPINYGRIRMGIKSPRQGRPAGLPGTFDPHADSAIMISWILWIWGPIWQNYINKTCLECDFASNKVKKIILPCPVKFGVSAQPPTYLLTLQNMQFQWI